MNRASKLNVFGKTHADYIKSCSATVLCCAEPLSPLQVWTPSLESMFGTSIRT